MVTRQLKSLVYILFDCLIIIQYKGASAEASLICNNDAVVDHDAAIAAACSLGDPGIYMPVIGQGDKSMEVYCTMPICHTGESVIPKDPYDIKPPELPLNHPPTQSLHNTRMQKKGVPIKSKLKYILSICLLMGVAVWCSIFFGTPSRKVAKTHEGKNR